MSGTAQATRPWSFAVVAGAVLSACVGAADAAPSAKGILDATGVKGGLVVHLGCGEAQIRKPGATPRVLGWDHVESPERAK